MIIVITLFKIKETFQKATEFNYTGKPKSELQLKVKLC